METKEERLFNAIRHSPDKVPAKLLKHLAKNAQSAKHQAALERAASKIPNQTDGDTCEENWEYDDYNYFAVFGAWQ